jgi:putative ABC transport system permease protein
MRLLSVLWRRIVALGRRHRLERDLDDELGFHLAMRQADNVQAGLPPEEARLRARRQFGNVALIKEQTRDAWTFASPESWAQDIRYAGRSLRRSPGFALVAVLTLSLGIGANTAIFAVVNAVLLRPLPYRDAGRLVRLAEIVPAAESPDGRPRRSGSISVAELIELRRHTTALSHVAFSGGPALMTISGRGEAARLQGMRVAPGMFETLGVPPHLGRGFTASEEAPGGDAVIIFSYSAWRRHFSGDAGIVGQSVTLANSLTSNPQASSRAYTVVGIMPQGFEFADAQMQFWIPVQWAPSTRGSMMGRLAEGVSRQEAAAETGAILREMRHAKATVSYELVAAQDGVVEPIKPALLMLTVASAFVLAIACVNVANLLFARSATRQREIAIRAALGSGRIRLLRLLLTESVMLGLVGGLGGTLLAVGGVRLLKTLATTLGRMDLGVQLLFPRLEEIGMDASVLAYVVATSLVIGVVFGLGPAVRHSRPGHEIDTLRESAATAYSGFGLLRRGRTRALLVCVEIALAMMLVAGGGLLMHSFLKLSAVDPGYDPENVLTFQVALPAGRYPLTALKAFADDLVARMPSVPGVLAAAHGQLPLVGLRESAFFRRTPDVPQRPAPGGPEIRLISRDYLEVMGIKVIAGRGFGDSDRAGQPRVLLINEVLARRDFPGENPVGQQVFAGPDPVPWEIAGVVNDVRQSGLDQDPEPQVFAQVSQWPGTTVFPLGPYFSVRTRSDPAAIIPHVRGIARQIDPDAGLFNVATMEQVVSNRISRPRMYAVLLGIFAGVAGALAAIGIYGVMAYSVAQRTREIGIRMALGARPSEVMVLVLGQSTLITVIGIIAGLAGAAGATRYLQGMLFGLTPLDPFTFVVVSILFAAVAMLAAYLPARSATKVDPLVALRSE